MDYIEAYWVYTSTEKKICYQWILSSTTNKLLWQPPTPDTRNKNNLKSTQRFLSTFCEAQFFFLNGIKLQYRMFSVVFMSGIAEHSMLQYTDNQYPFKGIWHSRASSPASCSQVWHLVSPRQSRNVQTGREATLNRDRFKISISCPSVLLSKSKSRHWPAKIHPSSFKTECSHVLFSLTRCFSS